MALTEHGRSPARRTTKGEEEQGNAFDSMAEHTQEMAGANAVQTAPKERREHWVFLVPLVLQNTMLGAIRGIFPVLYPEFVQYFGIGAGAAGWIGSVQSGGEQLLCGYIV
jgi:hypothetical protein